MKTDCCEAMQRQLSIVCDQHGACCPDRVILPTDFPTENYRHLLVAQNAAYDFEFCPWCGQRVQEPDGGGTGTRRLHS